MGFRDPFYGTVSAIAEPMTLSGGSKVFMKKLTTVIILTLSASLAFAQGSQVNKKSSSPEEKNLSLNYKGEDTESSPLLARYLKRLYKTPEGKERARSIEEAKNQLEFQPKPADTLVLNRDLEPINSFLAVVSYAALAEGNQKNSLFKSSGDIVDT